jgi:AraC-like DNA-binding protein
MPQPKAFKKSPTLSILDWRDRRADERMWLLTKTGLKSSVLIVRHAGNSIWRKGASIARKNSDIYGIELVTAGNLHFIQNGKEYIIEPGSIFIKRLGHNHVYEPGPAGFVHKRFVRLDGPIIETITGELGIEQIDMCRLSHPADFAALQKRAISLIKDQPPNYTTLLSLLAFEILLFVAQDVSGSTYPSALLSSLEHMRRNLHRKMTISELSHEAGISMTQYFRLFKKHVHESPLIYFNAMKIRRAAELLRHTLMPIKEIAFNLGYDEPAYFTNQFRKTMGVSPREYRKKT